MRRLDSRFIHFETTPEAPAAPEPGLEPTAPEAPAPEAAAPEAPAAPEMPEWAGTLGEHVATLARGQEELYGLLSPEEPVAPAEQPSGPEWDPLDPESVRNFIRHEADQRAEQMFQERVGPFEHVLGTVAEQQGEQIARSEFETIEKDLGKFSHDQALALTQSMIAAGVEPLQAVQAAAQRQHAFEAELKESWEAERAAHLTNLSGAPAEPGPPGGGAIEQPAPPANPHEAAQRGGPSRYEQIGLSVVGRQRPEAA